MAALKSNSFLSTAWLAVALLVPVALLNYMDRQMLASMKTSVMEDVPAIANDAGWGMVLACFKLTYAFLSPLGGYIADRFGKKIVIVSSLSVWSLITWMTGHVATFEQLLATRALMGISEAFYIPAALALISDYHLGATRSRAIGIHQMGIYAGVILGGFTGYIADSPTLGWRWAFSAAGLLGLLYAVPLFFFLKEPARDAARENERQLPLLKSTKDLFYNNSFLVLVLYFTFPALAAWIVRDWMPSILRSEFGIGQGTAGVSASLFWQLAAIAGAIGGGWLADRWMKRTIRGRIYVSAIGVALLIPAIFGMGYAPTSGMLWVAILFLTLFGLGWGFYDCNNMPILCQIVKPDLRASAYGIMNFVSISCGGLADWWFGELKTHGVPLFAIFSILAGFASIAFVIVFKIRPIYSDDVKD